MFKVGPVPDGEGGVEFRAASGRTADFATIGQRLNDFGLRINQSALNDLNRIRNDVEHYYTDRPHEAVRVAIAKAFTVATDLFRLAGVEPHEVLGEAWEIMLEVRAVSPVHYHRCISCGFIFTPHCDNFSTADFAREIYNDDYVKVDPDYLKIRPKALAEICLKQFGNVRDQINILDYGSGSGLMADLLNAQGFNVRNYDPFSTANNKRPDGKFDVITCFEVLEHTADPLLTCDLMQKSVKSNGIILFSTLVQPQTIETLKLSWWYIAPRNGHISIYTKRSLELVWAELGYKFVSLNDDLHVAYR